jgi:hypothetical protein
MPRVELALASTDLALLDSCLGLSIPLRACELLPR